MSLVRQIWRERSDNEYRRSLNSRLRFPLAGIAPMTGVSYGTSLLANAGFDRARNELLLYKGSENWHYRASIRCSLLRDPLVEPTNSRLKLTPQHRDGSAPVTTTSGMTACQSFPSPQHHDSLRVVHGRLGRSAVCMTLLFGECRDSLLTEPTRSWRYACHSGYTSLGTWS